MKGKSYQSAYPVTFIVVMVAFLATLCFTIASPSFAATKPAAAVRTSAVDHTEAQIKQLNSALGITEAQKPLWENVTRAMRENAKEMDAFTKERAEATKTMNSVERMKFHNQITKAQLAQQEKLLPPFEAFYASMSDQQKSITDLLFRTGKHAKSRRK